MMSRRGTTTLPQPRNTHMERGNLSRRGFMQRSLAALTLGAGLPAWYAREVFAAEEEKKAEKKPVGTNEKIIMGALCIGSPQSRGRAIMHEARGQKGVHYVAACDV